jgi:hypothetical protein
MKNALFLLLSFMITSCIAPQCYYLKAGITHDLTTATGATYYMLESSIFQWDDRIQDVVEANDGYPDFWEDIMKDGSIWRNVKQCDTYKAD